MNRLNAQYLTNEGFLNAVSSSFDAFLYKGTSRSTDKLKPLHGAIALDIATRLGEGYEVWSQGYRRGKEADIDGRYVSKRVDITIKKDDRVMAGIAVKFVMQNYSQNSNNYFENMLGETANIRCAGYPYFQVFVILDRLPYYNKAKVITKWQTFTDHHMEKYEALSKDNVDVYMHTPNKTLIYVVHLPEPAETLRTLAEYLDYYRRNPHGLTLSAHRYTVPGNTVILNDYEAFINKVYHAVMAL